MNLARPAALALRILALYLCAGAFVGLSQAIAYATAATDNEQRLEALWIMGTAAVAQAGIGLVVFIWAGPLGRIMAPDSGAEPSRGHTEIGGVALRVLGIVLWIWALQEIARSATYFRGYDQIGDVVGLASGVVLIAAGSWLFFSGASIARWLTRTPPAEDSRAYSRAQAITTSIAGLVLVAMGLPEVIEVIWLTIRAKTAGADSELFGLAAAGPRTPWIPIAHVVLGLLMFFGGRGISVTWHRLRNAGLSAEKIGQPQDGRG